MGQAASSTPHIVQQANFLFLEFFICQWTISMIFINIFHLNIQSLKELIRKNADVANKKSLEKMLQLSKTSVLTKFYIVKLQYFSKNCKEPCNVSQCACGSHLVLNMEFTACRSSAHQLLL